MRVLVLGAGVVGVTSAWYLAEAGHEVTVLERQGEAAMETSFANGGVLLSPFHDFDATIPAALKSEIDALKAAIVGGSVKVCTFLAGGCS